MLFSPPEALDHSLDESLRQLQDRHARGPVRQLRPLTQTTIADVHPAAVEVGVTPPHAQRLHDPDTLPSRNRVRILAHLLEVGVQHRQPRPRLIQGQPCRPGRRTARKGGFSGASGLLDVYLNPGFALDHGDLKPGAGGVNQRLHSAAHGCGSR